MGIRQATKNDIPAIVALQTRIEEEGALWGFVADSADDWKSRSFDWTYAAEEHGDLVAFIHCAPRPFDGECVFDEESRILEILDLCVAESSRDRGIGSDLVHHARTEARAAGFTHLRVYSAAKRFDDILAFYRSCGFDPWYLEMTQAL